MRARIVLDDCRIVLDSLDSATDERSFRIHWVALVTLLRAVGHVLEKVDATNDARLRRAVNAKWTEWKTNRDENRIFWDFVEAERNSVLKTYEANYHPGDVDIVVTSGSNSELFVLDEAIFQPMLDGLYAGEDARDVAQEALAWWERQLAEIEALRDRGA